MIRNLALILLLTLLGGCVDFLRPMSYVLLVGTGSNVRVFRYNPDQRTLTEATGSPVAAGGTVNGVGLDVAKTTLWVAEATNHRYRGFAINPRTLSLTVRSSTNYVNAPGGICFVSNGGAFVFTLDGSASSQAGGASVNSTGSLVIGTNITSQGFRCLLRPNYPNELLYVTSQVERFSISASGSATLMGAGSSGRDAAETINSSHLLAVDSLAVPQVTVFSVLSGTPSDTIMSTLTLTGAAEVERLGDLFYVSTGAQNSVVALRVSSGGVVSTASTNSVSGAPSVLATDPTETYLAVNGSSSGITTIYTTTTTGTLTAVASANTGVANTMVLDLIGSRN